MITVFKFLMYITPTLIPLILPLTILLASIMVFGNFAENYEFAAMKSTGISLQRAMSGLGIFIVGLSILTFFFSNNIIPWAEYNSHNLRKNIAKVKPAMAIAEGQFNDIGESFNIKVEKKSGENGKLLENITIHKKNGNKYSGNNIVIVADHGELASKENSNTLKLILFDGYYYEDVMPKKTAERNKKPFVKTEFKKHVMNIDLSELNNIDLDEKNVDNKYTMLNVTELNYTIDSLKTQRTETIEEFSTALLSRTNLGTLNLNVKTKKDTTYNGEILDVFKTKRKIQVLDYAINSINSTQQIIKSKKKGLEGKNSWIFKHGIQLHKKFALAIACIILFFIGAPLGALIKKGGLGLPMVIAIVLFLSYHFIGLFAENSAKNGTLNPVLSAWFSTLILFPLSIYLTSRATADKGLFETDGVLDPLKKLFGLKKKPVLAGANGLAETSEAFQQLNGLDNNQLIDLQKNYRQYNKTIEHKNSALSILNKRGITEQNLKLTGNLVNHKYEDALRLKQAYDEDSKLALVLYVIAFICVIVGSILKNNKFPTIGNILFVFGIVMQIVFIFALVKAFSKQSNLYKHLDKDSNINGIIYALFGFPIYIALYFIEKKNIEKDLHIAKQDKKASKKLKNTSTIDTSSVDTSNIEDHSNYNILSKLSLIFFSIAFILFVLYFVFKNNKLPQFANSGIQISAISYIVFIFNYIKSTLEFKRIKKGNLLTTLLGIILYPITHFFRRQKIKT